MKTPRLGLLAIVMTLITSPAALSAKLPIEDPMPSLARADAWLNSRPLSTQELRGKVVLVDFWTYTCINWRRTLPHLRAWAEKYRDHGLVIVGVHTPEFSFEQNVDNVRRAAQEQDVDYPIALDSDYAIWNAFDNHYWPAVYLVDANGHIRHQQFGEGNYEQLERVIQRLLAEAEKTGFDRAPVTPDARGAEVAADWKNLGSPETYVGSRQAERFVSAAPSGLKLNQWTLTGNWTTRDESAVLNKAGGKIAFRFHARDVHLVMGSSTRGAAVRFRVSMDGQPPRASHGVDVDAEGNGTLDQARMYQLIRQQAPIADRQIEIEFLDPGAEVFVFTFGQEIMRTSMGVLLALAMPATALGQEGASTPAGVIDEIIVTAQKWEQSANTVGMSISAATGEALEQRGITSVAELTRLVPGLTIEESSFNSTSFTLRGVGFFNSDLATPPAVTVYVDEAPLPYPAMTKLAAFDLARVEVLKGPQGTLYGQNATGGAVNYIAAKPTERFEAGFDTIYGRFNRVQVGGFVSGPIGDQLTARLALQGRSGDAWQESISRPGDELGKIRELQSRATLEWQPAEQFVSRLTLTFTHDGSDSIAAQFIAPAASIPPLAVPGLLAFPVVTQPRAADWTPVRPDTNMPFPYDSDTTLYQASWRNDYHLRDDITLTSLTSYADLSMAYGQDPDGTPFHVSELIDRDGSVSAFFQELRVAGRQGRVNWLLGANYTRDRVEDRPKEFFSDNDVGRLLIAFDPQAFGDEGQFTGRMEVRTYAAFGRIEFAASDHLMLEAAVRYNADRRTFDHCAITTSEHFARFWNLIRGGAQPPTEIGDCWVLDPANALQPVDNVHHTLDEDSESWRAGLNWTARPDLLLYANVSQGYKAGAVPVLAASTVAQLEPVPQESLLAYEAGVKAGLFDRHAQLNVSAFYYDYEDKQLRGAVLDPTFGPLEALVSIPKSHVVGAEAQLVARLTDGLTLDTAAIYTKSQIDQFTGFDARAQFGDQSGTPFPFSPEWQSITNLDYEFPLSPTLNGFLGGSLIYNSETFAGVGALDLFRIDSFTLLDLRAGVGLDGGRYRVWAWGKNVTDEYHWSNVFANGNAIARFVGQPATYGISLSARF